MSYSSTKLFRYQQNYIYKTYVLFDYSKNYSIANSPQTMLHNIRASFSHKLGKNCKIAKQNY